MYDDDPHEGSVESEVSDGMFDDPFDSLDRVDDMPESEGHDLGWAELGKRQDWDDILGGVGEGVGVDEGMQDGGDGLGDSDGYEQDGEDGGFDSGQNDGFGQDEGGDYGGGIGGELDEGGSTGTGTGSGGNAAVYTAPITYSVRKTGYYCIGKMNRPYSAGVSLIDSGIVPVTLVNSRDNIPTPRQATHAEYSGLVLFRNTFDGELPAVEYPKIGVRIMSRHIGAVLIDFAVLFVFECRLLRPWMRLGIPVCKAQG